VHGASVTRACRPRSNRACDDPHNPVSALISRRLIDDAAKSRCAFAAPVNQGDIFLGLRTLPLLLSIG
jgi:hypothetical protein